jgi:hypothetical protein
LLVSGAIFKKYVKQEAIRVVKTMPDWNPGKQNGKPVDIDYVERVSFKVK